MLWNHGAAADAATASRATIVDVARGTKVRGTLLAAAQAAGMAETLASPGPWKVLAPVDSAFVALREATVAALLEAGNVATLCEVLGFHVIAGSYSSADVVKLTKLRTVSGQRVPVDVRKDGVFVGGARITTADVMASNGGVHVVDGVFMPATDDRVTTAMRAGMFNTGLAAVAAADLVGALNGDTPLTVLAPSDAAFAALDQKLLASLLEPQNKARLAAVHKLHVIPGRLSALDLAKSQSVETLAGERLPVRVVDGRVTVGGVAPVGNDIESTGARIHVLGLLTVEKFSWTRLKWRHTRSLDTQPGILSVRSPQLLCTDMVGT